MSPVAGDLGVELEVEAAAVTAALHPPHVYVPWVTVNGVAIGQGYQFLLTFVCAAYTGDRCDPRLCSATTSVPARWLSIQAFCSVGWHRALVAAVGQRCASYALISLYKQKASLQWADTLPHCTQTASLLTAAASVRRPAAVESTCAELPVCAAAEAAPHAQHCGVTYIISVVFWCMQCSRICRPGIFAIMDCSSQRQRAKGIGTAITYY